MIEEKYGIKDIKVQLNHYLTDLITSLQLPERNLQQGYSQSLLQGNKCQDQRKCPQVSPKSFGFDFRKKNSSQKEW